MVDLGNGFDLSSCIFCEGFRTETGGKLMLYGIFTGHILVQSLPATFMGGVYLGFEKLGQGKHTLKVRTEADGFKVDFGVDIETTDQSGGAIPMPPVPIHVAKEAPLIVSLSIDDGPWHKLLEKEVKVGVLQS